MTEPRIQPRKGLAKRRPALRAYWFYSAGLVCIILVFVAYWILTIWPEKEIETAACVWKVVRTQYSAGNLDL